ncbi:hypothetical protein V6Z94_010081 [Aspergillus fumigatus]
MPPAGIPASVEADGHVRVAASVPVDGARLSGADKGARAGQLVTSGASRVRLGVSRPGVGPWRAPANWSPPVPASVSLGQRLSMARALACRRPACPRGSRQLVTLPPARAAPPPRQLGQPTGRRALACAPPPPPPPRPPRPPRPPFVALARAALCSPRGRAPTGPPAPLNRLPSTGTLARAAGGLLLHIPTDLARPIIVRANVPGSERRSGGRPTCAGRPRAARAAMCPSQLVTALRHQAAAARVPRGHLGRPTGESPWRWRSRGDRPSPVPPASPEKGVWAPLQAPGAAGPVDGRCLPTNLAKDRADAQRLVATRLLDRLHDPLGHFSRLQRIHPRAR